jgi:hypothetical protein
MIKPGAIVMTVLMVGVAAGTYYGLDYVPLPSPIGRAPPPEKPKLAGSAFTEAPAAETAAATPAPAPQEAPMTEQDLAEEPPPQEPAAAPAPAPAPAEPAPQAAAAPEAPAPKPKPKASDPEFDQPAPKPTASDAEQVAKAETPAATEPEAPKTPKAKPPEADVIKPWWPNPDKMPANQLKLQYAGQVQGEQAIALLFSSPLNLDALKAHAKIRTKDGSDAKGQWELGKNPRLAVYRGVEPGRYTVILQPQVADQKGFMLGTTLQGPVYIQQP